MGVCSLKALEQSGTQQPGREAMDFRYCAAINLGRGKKSGEITEETGRSYCNGERFSHWEAQQDEFLKCFTRGEKNSKIFILG